MGWFGDLFCRSQTKKLDALSKQIEDARKDILRAIEQGNDPELKVLTQTLRDHTKDLAEALKKNP